MVKEYNAMTVNKIYKARVYQLDFSVIAPLFIKHLDYDIFIWCQVWKCKFVDNPSFYILLESKL